MKKYALLLLALVAAFAFAACTDTVADISTSDGGEVKVTESDVGTVEENVEAEDGGEVDAKADVDSYTITYTDPEGYTVEESGGGSVTYTLDGNEVGKIVYVPAAVDAQLMDRYYAALEADEEQLKEYAAEYAENLDVDYQVTKEDINGVQAIVLSGTVAEGSTEGNPGDTAYIMVMPVGEQMVVLRGFADAETAAQIKDDMSTFAKSMHTTGSASQAASMAESALQDLMDSSAMSTASSSAAA